MLVRLADRLQRQDEHVEVVRHERRHAPEIALVDEGVDADRQMRSVLLDRRDGQDRDRAVHVAGAEIFRRQIEPETRRHVVLHVIPGDPKSALQPGTTRSDAAVGSNGHQP